MMDGHLLRRDFLFHLERGFVLLIRPTHAERFITARLLIPRPYRAQEFAEGSGLIGL